MSDVKKLRPASRIIHAGQRACPLTGAVSTPIYQTSTFAFKDTDEGAARFGGTDPGYKYTRLGNPTVAVLEECINELEGGCGALAASTGMAAGMPSCAMLTSVPQDTCRSDTVVRISPGRPGSSKLSVWTMRSPGTGSRYRPPKAWLAPVEKYVNDIR